MQIIYDGFLIVGDEDEGFELFNRDDDPYRDMSWGLKCVTLEAAKAEANRIRRRWAN